MSRRLLHAAPRVPDLAGGSIVRATPHVDPRVPQYAQFQVLGSGSFLQVNLPPSTSLYANRNRLTAVLGTAEVTARLRVAKSPLSRIWARQGLLEQSVKSTGPTTCLVGTGARRPHITSLELDGSRDWCVTPPAQIHAYSGRGLSVAPRTGWRFGSLVSFAHVLVSGRGLAAFTTPAPVVQLPVESGDSVLVHRSHLAAFSLDVNAALTAPKRTSVSYTLPTYKVQTIEPLRWKRWIRTSVDTLKSWIDRVARRGNYSSYIQIYGPATVLVSASAPAVTYKREGM